MSTRGFLRSDTLVDLAATVDFLAARDRCTWRRAPASTLHGQLRVVHRPVWRPSNDGVVLPGDVDITASVPGSSCVLALDGARYAGDASAKLEAWIVRTGPFEIAAGGAALIQFRPRVPPPGAYAISSVAKMADANTSQWLPYPPLHDHHSVTWNQGDAVLPSEHCTPGQGVYCPGPTGARSHQLDFVVAGPALDPFHKPSSLPGGYGDKACVAELGGTACAMNWLPCASATRKHGCTGQLVQPSSTPFFDAIYNSVAERALRVFHEHAVVWRLDSGKQRVAPLTPYTIYLRHPWKQPFNTYPVWRSLGPTVHFRTVRMPEAGRLVGSSFHHHSFLSESWVLAATEAQLGLPLVHAEGVARLREGKRFPGLDRVLPEVEAGLIPLPIANTSETQTRLRRALAAAAPAAGAARPRLLCRYYRPPGGVYAAMLKRAGEADECSSWRFEAGDAATIVGWHDRVKDQEAGHAVWFAYTVLDRWRDLLSRPGAAAVLARSGQK